MGYLQRLNDALDYIESNLDGHIDYNEAAGIACCSVNYFQRIFMLIVDMPLSEYIRRRRMTLAALELQSKSVKVIDLAIKYGYESPDSFTRAFKKIHGVVPTKVCDSGISVKAYPRIAFNISIRGDVEMNYRIEEKAEMRIVGVKRSYKGPKDDESVVPKFWKDIHHSGLYEKLLSLQNGEPEGVHGFLEVKGEVDVDYIIGCISDKEPLPGTQSYIIPRTTWAIFEIVGSVATSMAGAWKRIFCEWLPESDYKYAETVDIECFSHEGNKLSESYKYEIWIPVVKK